MSTKPIHLKRFEDRIHTFGGSRRQQTGISPSRSDESDRIAGCSCKQDGATDTDWLQRVKPCGFNFDSDSTDARPAGRARVPAMWKLITIHAGEVKVGVKNIFPVRQRSRGVIILHKGCRSYQARAPGGYRQHLAGRGYEFRSASKCANFFFAHRRCSRSSAENASGSAFLSARGLQEQRRGTMCGADS